MCTPAGTRHLLLVEHFGGLLSARFARIALEFRSQNRLMNRSAASSAVLVLTEMFLSRRFVRRARPRPRASGGRPVIPEHSKVETRGKSKKTMACHFSQISIEKKPTEDDA